MVVAYLNFLFFFVFCFLKMCFANFGRTQENLHFVFVFTSSLDWTSYDEKSKGKLGSTNFFCSDQIPSVQSSFVTHYFIFKVLFLTHYRISIENETTFVNPKGDFKLKRFYLSTLFSLLKKKSLT